MTAPLLCPRCQQQWSRPALTKRQAEVYAYVETYLGEHRYAPSCQEIAQHFGFRSLATVVEHLRNLQEKGYLVRRHNEARGLYLNAKNTNPNTEDTMLPRFARRGGSEDQQAEMIPPLAHRRSSRPLAPTELEIVPRISGDISADPDEGPAGAERIAKRVLALVEAMTPYIPADALDAAYRDAMRAFREAA